MRSVSFFISCLSSYWIVSSVITNRMFYNIKSSLLKIFLCTHKFDISSTMIYELPRRRGGDSSTGFDGCSISSPHSDEVCRSYFPHNFPRSEYFAHMIIYISIHIDIYIYLWLFVWYYHIDKHLIILFYRRPAIYIRAPICVQPHIVGDYISEPSHINELHVS